MTLIRPILRWGSSPPPPPPVDNYVRVLVGDATGRILAELEIDVGPVAWRLNKISKLPLEIAATDPLATRDHLRFGNRLLVQFRNGLPDWGGVIEPPRRWKDGAIQFTAYSAEELLRRWLTDAARTFTAASAGQLYEGLIADATAMAGVNVAIGDVWQGGKSYSPEYHLDGVLEKVQRQLVDSYGVDFYISASESEGVIVFTAHLYERRGTVKQGVALLEGDNVERAELIEQGPIVNWWAIPGAGSTWDDSRPIGYAQDEASIGEYGLRQDAEMHSDVEDPATLDAIAANRLAETAQPHNMVVLTTLNLEPALYSAYDVGDSVRVRLYSIGFGGYDHMVRIVAREYNPRTGVCRLVGREND